MTTPPSPIQILPGDANVPLVISGPNDANRASAPQVTMPDAGPVPGPMAPVDVVDSNAGEGG